MRKKKLVCGDEGWAEAVLKEAGIEWKEEKGILYHATDDEKALGIKDMTFEDYLATVPSTGVVPDSFVIVDDSNPKKKAA